jgi:hypothetical protein
MAHTTQKERPFGTQESMPQQARETASNAMDTAKDVAAAAGKKASEAASYVGQKAEDATTAVGSSMKSLAGTIRDSGPHEGMLGNASSAVASTLESGGRYLEQHGLKGIGEDLTNVIRRNPIPTLLIAVGLGYLVARATRS